MPEVGLIGIGLVGKALAERLLKAGYRVVGYDVDPQCRAELARLGGEPVESCVDVVQRVGTCILSLPNSDIVGQVLHEIESKLGDKQLIDTTTGDPAHAAAVGARLQQRQINYLDATIVGSSKQVRNGEVVVLVGGAEAAFQQCLPILSTFAKHSFYLGSWGSGARMKLVVNLVLGLNRAVLAEGLAFANACGIQPASALEVLRSSMAYSKIMDTKGSKMLDRDYSVEAKLSQHHKDVRLILAAAHAAGLEVPLSSVHDQILNDAEMLGLGDMDNSAIIEVFRQNSDSK